MTIEVNFAGGKKINASVYGEIVRTDQPVNSGGEGSAPSPFTLFLASIGTCAGVYIQSFCSSRGIPFENIRILQHLEMDPQTRLIGKVNLEVVLPSDFPEKYRKAVLSAADVCTVKKHLANPPEITIDSTIS